MKKQFSARVNLIEHMHFRGENPSQMGAEMDSRPEGEPVAGASPMELILQAAGGCSGMDVVFILRKRKLEPEQFEVLLEGTKREEHPRIYEKIRMIYRAKGEGITLEELEKASALSFNTYCAVVGMLKQACDITYTCELIE